MTFLVGPPLLGFVEHWGIRWAFGLGMPLIVLSLLVAGALGKKAPSAKPEAEPKPRASEGAAEMQLQNAPAGLD